MAELTHCARVRKRPQRVHKCSQAFPSIRAGIILLEVLALLDRVAASHVKSANSHGAWGAAGNRCCFVACEKLMSDSRHRDAAPWGSHLGNLLSESHVLVAREK